MRDPSSGRRTATLTIRLENDNLEINGGSGSGEDNWDGTWIKQ
jgi:hypothetical protein